MTKKRKTPKQRDAFSSWTRTEIDRTLNPVCKNCCKAATRNLFKRMASRLNTEERAEALQSLFLEDDACGIDFVVSLIVISHTLREELLAWLPDVEWRVGLSKKEQMQFMLRGFVEHFGVVDIRRVRESIEEVQGGVEADAIDFICETIDAVHELRDDIALWAEPAHGAIN
jgi:hypothetical protein